MSLPKLGLTAALATALAIAAVGCGDSNDGSSTSTAAPAATTPPAAATTSSGSSGGSSSTSANPQIKAAIAACKQSINANPQVPANVKGDLVGICDKAASGDAAAVKSATKQVCLKIVASAVPASAQETAKAACDSAGG